MSNWPDDEIMERWDVIHQNTNQIAKAMKLTQPQVERVVAWNLDGRHADRKAETA